MKKSIKNFSRNFLQKIINNHKNGKKYSSNDIIIGDRQCNAENKKKENFIQLNMTWWIYDINLN